ncbi:MAG: DNA translocase FtsK 4TM domain-containing protein [Chitinivibrionia bacterium]|nr:DNA translocase FtsK 4TM domain-containing protein [Chitinivibrionia bacterium]
MNTSGRKSFFVISFVAFAAFLAAALMQHHPHDWPFDGGASIGKVRNMAGPFGSFAAWVCIQVLGSLFAWLIPLSLIAFAGTLAFDKTAKLGRGLLKAASMILLLNAFFALLEVTSGSSELSGWAGRGIAAGLQGVFGRVGGTIFVTACLLILALSFLGFLGRIGVPRFIGWTFVKKAVASLFSMSGKLVRFIGGTIIKKAVAWLFSFFKKIVLAAAGAARARASQTKGIVPERGKSHEAAPPAGVGGGAAESAPEPPAEKHTENGGADLTAQEAVLHIHPALRKRMAKAQPAVQGGTLQDAAVEKPHEDGKVPIEEASLPPFSLFDGGKENGLAFPQDKLKAWAAVLEEKLAYYKIEGKVTGISHGPLITTFEFAPNPGVKVKDIVSRADDLTLAMKAKSLRLIAPIPGRSVVGIEIPNPEGALVYLRDILPEIPERLRLSGVMVGIGVDVMGKPFFMNLCNAPHLLVAGTTGSGKSVALHGILASILMHYRPSDVRLLIVDPKMVEMNIYNGLPHLLHPVTNDPKETVRMFQYLVEEMERRKELLKESGVKNIESYNSKAAMDGRLKRDNEKLPYIILVIDELGDLILSKGVDMESLLSKLSNMARAVGIHMVVATQRPSVDVIVGKTKANFPTRIAFRVASRVDSRTILDSIGAEKLLGRGDMLYMDAKHIEPIRLHGAYISEAEVERVISHWKSYRFEPATLEVSKEKTSSSWDDMEEDPLYEEAKQVVLHYRQGSTSLLQRRLHIGYARAARLLDMHGRHGSRDRVAPPRGALHRGRSPRSRCFAGELLLVSGICMGGNARRSGRARRTQEGSTTREARAHGLPAGAPERGFRTHAARCRFVSPSGEARIAPGRAPVVGRGRLRRAGGRDAGAGRAGSFRGL